MTTIKKWLIRFAAGVLLIVCVSMTVGAIWHASETKKTHEKFPCPGKLYDAGGHRLHLLVKGEGAPGDPVVVMDTGIANGCFAYFELQDKVCEFAKVCIFDRAGYGWSEQGPNPRTPQQTVSELRIALRNANLDPPYVLLGGSLGGLNMRYFASNHPDEVAGLVLEDAFTMDTWDEDVVVPLPFILKVLYVGRGVGLARLAGIPAEPNPQNNEYARMQSEFALQSKTYHAWYGEMSSGKDWKAVRDSMHFLGNMPVTVLSAKNNQLEWAKEWWADGQKALQSISNDVVAIEADTGHGIAHENPELVTDAIREVLRRIEAKDSVDERRP